MIKLWALRFLIVCGVVGAASGVVLGIMLWTYAVAWVFSWITGVPLT